MRRWRLIRDRRETSSLVSVSELIARSSRLSHENTQKCQHAEDGRAATLVNTIGPITFGSVPRLQSHESRPSSIRTQVHPTCDPTTSNLHIQVRDTCDLCEIARLDSGTKRIAQVIWGSRQSRTQARYRCLRPTEGESVFRAAQFIYRRRESPRSEGSRVRAKPEGRRQEVEHAQIHGGVTQGPHARS